MSPTMAPCFRTGPGIQACDVISLCRCIPIIGCHHQPSSATSHAYPVATRASEAQLPSGTSPEPSSRPVLLRKLFLQLFPCSFNLQELGHGMRLDQVGYGWIWLDSNIHQYFTLAHDLTRRLFQQRESRNSWIFQTTQGCTHRLKAQGIPRCSVPGGHTSAQRAAVWRNVSSSDLRLDVPCIPQLIAVDLLVVTMALSATRVSGELGLLVTCYPGELPHAD